MPTVVKIGYFSIRIICFSPVKLTKCNHTITHTHINSIEPNAIQYENFYCTMSVANICRCWLVLFWPSIVQFQEITNINRNTLMMIFQEHTSIKYYIYTYACARSHLFTIPIAQTHTHNPLFLSPLLMLYILTVITSVHRVTQIIIFLLLLLSCCCCCSCCCLVCMCQFEVTQMIINGISRWMDLCFFTLN